MDMTSFDHRLTGRGSMFHAMTPGEWAHGHRRTYSFDAPEAGIIDEDYLDGIDDLGMIYPQMRASIYLICGK